MDWERWQRSWDRQQELYLPDREERFRVMLDVVEAVAGPTPRVLDLACGTGSISRRLFARLPHATSIGVDLDPALLTIARGSFADDPRIRLVSADLHAPDWIAEMPDEPFDAVVTATALHWLTTPPLLRLYADLAKLLRPGGVFLNADHMPDPGRPLLHAADENIRRTYQDRARRAGALDWEGWWAAAAAEPNLADAVSASQEIYGTDDSGDTHPADWHIARLLESGFLEAGVVWRCFGDAMVAAIR